MTRGVMAVQDGCCGVAGDGSGGKLLSFLVVFEVESADGRVTLVFSGTRAKLTDLRVFLVEALLVPVELDPLGFSLLTGMT